MLKTEQSLSAREVEVVKLVAAGLPSKEIADRLQVSLNTIKTHLARIFGKAGVRTRTELTAWWLGRAIRPPSPNGATTTHPESVRRPNSLGRIAVASALILAIALIMAIVWSGTELDSGASPAGANAAESARTVSINGEPAGNAVALDCSGKTSAPEACSEGAGAAKVDSAQEFPALTITSPEAKSAVTGPSVTIDVVVTDFALVPETGTSAVPGEGHIIYYLDYEPDFVPGQSAIPDDPDVAHAASHELSHTFAEVAPGPHTVYALLVLDDNTPVVPPAIWNVEFVVAKEGTPPAPQPTAAVREIDRTATVDQAPQVSTEPVAVLPAALPVVGSDASARSGLLAGTGPAALVAAGIVLAVLGAGSLALAVQRRRSD